MLHLLSFFKVAFRAMIAAGKFILQHASQVEAAWVFYYAFRTT
jgi:hypothetical protein